MKFTTQFLLSCSLLVGLSASARSIIPFLSAGHMLEASDLSAEARVLSEYSYTVGEITYYGYELQVIDLVKAEQNIDRFRVQLGYNSLGPDGIRTSFDYGFSLIEGGNYMLFLRQVNEGEYVPLTGSLGVYTELSGPKGANFWVPQPVLETFVLEHPSGLEVAVPMVYEWEVLAKALRNRLADSQFAVETMASEIAPSWFALQSRMPPPSHCNSFSSNIGGTTRRVRWPNTAITIFRGPANPNINTTTAEALLQSSIASLNSNYPGLQLTYGGQTAVTGQGCLSDAISTPTPAAVRSIIVVFNNPCSNTGLSGCSGTLGVGGPSWSNATNTAANGDVYYSIVSGGVVVDPAAGCVGTNGFIRLLEHEITHALGFDHITSGTANMNPSCCINISTLDKACVNYVYAPPAPLPVELTDFAIAGNDKQAFLTWSTASERNSEAFVVERSADAKTFASLGSVKAMGISDRQTDYQFVDLLPLNGTSYYRLKQIDLDGASVHSNVVALERVGERRLVVYPNPAQSSSILVINGIENEQVTITLSDVSGRIVFHQDMLVSQGRSELELPPGLVAGMYYLRAIGQLSVQSLPVRLQ